MVARFLLMNGLKTANELIIDPIKNINYPRYEPTELLTTKFFEQFDNNEAIFIKDPLSIFWTDHIAKVSGREIKLIYVLRSPLAVMASTKEKSPNKDPMAIFYRWDSIYNKVMSFYGPTLYLFSEKPSWLELWKFCELKQLPIDLTGIITIHVRVINYLKFRINNFWLKIIFKLISK